MASSSIPKSSGIYKITCTENGKIYIGSSNNLRGRWRDHRNSLRRNNHQNPHLQNAWNKYGEDTFVFEIIELVMPWSRIDREQYWLDATKAYHRDIGFNLACQAQAGMGGRKHTPETRAKMSAIRKGKSFVSEEGWEIIRAKATGRKPNPETRAIISAKAKGRKHTPEARAKIGAASRGRKSPPRSPETREKCRAAKCRFTYTVTTPDGIEIEIRSVDQFCKEYPACPSVRTMRRLISGEHSDYKGWKCQKVED